MKKIPTVKVKDGLLNIKENNLNKIVENIVENIGYPVVNGCCFKGVKPTNNQVLVWNNTLNAWTYTTLTAANINIAPIAGYTSTNLQALLEEIIDNITV